METANLPPIDPEKGTWDDQAFSRRQFLETGFWFATGATGLVMFGSGSRFLVGASLAPRPEVWIEVGKTSDLPAREMHRVLYSFRSPDLWRDTEVKGILYAFSEDGQEYTVLDSTCSHLGCNVHWKQADDRFACPCHQGHFTRQGEVIDGPPPRALRRLQTRLENGVLQALI